MPRTLIAHSRRHPVLMSGCILGMLLKATLLQVRMQMLWCTIMFYSKEHFTLAFYCQSLFFSLKSVPLNLCCIEANQQWIGYSPLIDVTNWSNQRLVSPLYIHPPLNSRVNKDWNNAKWLWNLHKERRSLKNWENIKQKQDISGQNGRVGISSLICL